MAVIGDTLGWFYNALMRFKVGVYSLALGNSETGPLIEADSTRVKIPGLTLGATAITATGTQLNNLATLAGGITGAPLQVQRVLFTETTGAGTYSGSVTVPAGGLVHNIRVGSSALWTATTSALMDVGDAGDPDGWFTQINLKATDLLVGEEINFENFGGKQGAYLVAASGTRTNAYSTAERVISGIVVTVGAAGNAGRTYMEVIYSVPTAAAATKV